MTVLSYSDPKYNGRSPFLNYKINNWLHFLFIVKAAALKQQTSNFCPQIQRTEASYYIYFSQRPVITIKASLCAYNLQIKF